MSVKTKVEVFTAGCPACEEALELINSVACSSCDVEVHEMRNPEAAAKAKAYGIHRVPSVAVNGKLLDCCAAGPIDEAALREAGVGQE
jgi:glutaredoxin